jgi:hypothetical protein
VRVRSNFPSFGDGGSFSAAAGWSHCAGACASKGVIPRFRGGNGAESKTSRRRVRHGISLAEVLEKKGNELGSNEAPSVMMIEALGIDLKGERDQTKRGAALSNRDLIAKPSVEAEATSSWLAACFLSLVTIVSLSDALFLPVAARVCLDGGCPSLPLPSDCQLAGLLPPAKKCRMCRRCSRE